ncbi:MAG: hypothetical protein LBB18_00805 [Puniceicoccales bacterium]|jgi:type III secretion protein C|nr:hypothetical protein [Puniceicoccales bacterium]
MSSHLIAEEIDSLENSAAAFSVGALPFSKANYYHFAKDQKLPDLIKDFFSMQGITVVVSPRVGSIVNGRFSKMDPANFWDYVTKAYGLVWFFDGKIMFVYSNSELRTQIFRMDGDGIRTLSTILARLGFITSDFSFRGVGEANVLIVTAPPQYINVINDIVNKFVPSKISDTTIVKIIPLKYAWAYDMTFNYANGAISVPGVASLMQSIISGRQSTVALSPFNVNVGANNGQKEIKYQPMVGLLDDVPQYMKEVNNNVKKIEENSKNNSKNSSKSSGKKSESSSDEGDEQSGDGSKVIDIAGATLPGFIMCDQRLNAVIIRDRRENMPFYEDIIAKLDIPCSVIKVDVSIVNVNSNAATNFGVNFLTVHKKGANGITKQDIKITNNDGLGSIGAIRFGISRHLDVSVAIDALEKSGGGQTMSKPSVLTLDNVAAIMETDKTRYQALTGANTTNAYTQSASTRIQVVPHIIPGEFDSYGKRKMKLFVDIAEGDLPADSTQAVTQHSLNTQAVLYEGQSLMVGGYNTESNSSTRSGIPVLRDIPIIGVLFGHSNVSKEVKERIYVISPTVIEIRSDEHSYDKFVKPGNLDAVPTLAPEDYPITVKVSKSVPPKKRTRPRTH